jgi:MoaA/NifB/PqqE/SkfB family radical SAM enzyme
MLAIEIINQCNFSCYFCAVSYKKESLQQITVEEIKNLSKDIEELGINFIKLTPSRGEIFMHKDVYEILSILTNISTVKKIQFHTNFSLINFDKFFNSNIITRKLEINVSHYGSKGLEEFLFQTKKNKKDYFLVEKNIKESKEKKLKVFLDPRSREDTKHFEYEGSNHTEESKRLNHGICNNSWVPRIVSNGDFIYCTCSPDSSSLDDRYIIGNFRKTPFKELYLHPKRYLFYEKMKSDEMPDICKTCVSFTQEMYQPTVSVMKNFVKIIKKVS